MNSRNIAKPGEEPKWRSPDDELYLVILEDIDKADSHVLKQILPEVKGGYLGLYMEYLKYRDLVRNKKADPLVKWVFEGTHYGLQAVIVLMNTASRYLLMPVAHSIDDAQTIYQDLTGVDIGSNPSHSQLAKDHDDHPLHDIAAILAKEAVKAIGGKIYHHYLTNNGNDVVGSAFQYLVHPKDTNWYQEKLQNWANRNENKIERTFSRHAVEHYHNEVHETLEEIESTVTDWGIWGYVKKLFE